MNMTNNVAAKVLGEVLAKGMSIADVDLGYSVKCDAIEALCEIKNVMTGEKSDSEKVKEVESVMERYMVM